ncbi:MAG: ComEC/Rec2 family competence protein [Aggregatilineales bacterium]
MRLVYITIAWVIGMMLATNSAMTTSTWIVLSFIMAIGVGFGWSSIDYRIFNIVLLVLCLGGLRYSLVPTTSDVAQYNLTSGLTLEGNIIDPPDIRDDRIQFRINAEMMTRGGRTISTQGLVLVRAPRTANVNYGDRITVSGLLITPGEFDTFSYADFLARQGVYSIMTNAAIEVISTGHGSPFYSTLYDLRERANSYISNALPEPQAGLLSGILLGADRGISPNLEDDFSRVGASHVIAISGFNMVIIAGVIMSILSPGTEKPRPIAAITGLVVIGVYTILVGANAAVIRAALMSGLLIIGQVLNRRTYVPTSLAFVAVLLSFFNPNVLWDISFQLSFFATLGLALFVEPLTKRFNALLFYLFPAPYARPIGNFLSEPLIVSIAAQIFALPIIIAYFSQVSLVALLVNLLIIPVQAPLLLFGGLATIVAFFLPVLAQILFWIDLVLLSWTIGVVRAFADLPFADTEFRVDSRLISLYFLIILGWSLMHATQPNWWQRLGIQVRRQTVLATILISGVALAILMGAVAFSRPDGKLDVWFLDVGHSNGVLIETPGGAQILVDGGRFPSRLLTEIGDRLPFTDRDIEVLVITQPDEFDYGALPALLGRYDAETVLMNGQPNLSTAYNILQESLVDSRMINVTEGYTVETDDGVLIEILHPRTQPDIRDSLDDSAVVLRISYGEVSFLLTGDISREAQDEMLSAGAFPLATVMQLPQHGTARSLSPEFVAAVQPQAIAIQIDPANRRGDPAEAILNILGDMPIFRTDTSGTLHFWTDGIELWTDAEN